MNIHIVQKAGYNRSSSHNEFGVWSEDWLRVQTQYILVLEGALRDRVFNDTFKELNKFLNRLSKRLDVREILVSLKDYDREYIFKDDKPYADMYEWPSWANEDGEPAWWQYLMWDRGIDTWMPMALERKYYNNPNNDAEWERRQKVMKENN